MKHISELQQSLRSQLKMDKRKLECIAYLILSIFER